MNTYVITDYGVKKNETALQTAQFQAVLDLCRENGGTVVVPAGTYYISGVWMHSDTTLYLEAGARIMGSTNCEDYPIWPVPEGVEMRSDMEMITQYYGKPWDAYRRAMISSYGTKNISIIGEIDSVIDGQDCIDNEGEEGYRGPHGIYITNCENVLLRDYTIQHNGNFMHQLDKCTNVEMRNVVCRGGSDGIHLHCCEHTLITDCDFTTGDDCIAGINIRDLHVQFCKLNTSCNLFRMGGVGILVEKCHMYGPGFYPHRMTIRQKDGTFLPRTAGRHNTIALVDYFASMNFPFEPSHDIVFRDCVIENMEHLIWYTADGGPLCSGTYFAEMTLDDVVFIGVAKAARVTGCEKVPLVVKTRNVSVSFREGSEDTCLVHPDSPYTSVVEF